MSVWKRKNPSMPFFCLLGNNKLMVVEVLDGIFFYFIVEEREKRCAHGEDKDKKDKPVFVSHGASRNPC